jgi:hypothetical protein
MTSTISSAGAPITFLHISSETISFVIELSSSTFISRIEGLGTKKNQIVIVIIKPKPLATIMSHYHDPSKTSINNAASYIPAILPKLLQVAQSPTIKPLFFLGNQLPIIAMKHGSRKALNTPMKIYTKKK